MSAAERAVEASNAEQANECPVRANGRASSPVFQSVFLVVLAQSVSVGQNIRGVLNYVIKIYGAYNSKSTKNTGGIKIRGARTMNHHTGHEYSIRSFPPLFSHSHSRPALYKLCKQRSPHPSKPSFPRQYHSRWKLFESMAN